MFLLISLLMGSLFVLTSCGGSGLDIGIVLPTEDEPRWLHDRDRFMAALEGTDFSVDILFSQNSSAVERDNVDALIARGIDVLIIATVDGDAAAATAEIARNAGVTVIAHDRLIRGTTAIDYYVTFDSIEVGRAMGQYLIDNVEPGTFGNPLYLYTGSPADNNAFLFFEGTWDVLQPRIANGTFTVMNSSAAVGLQNSRSLTRDQMANIIGQTTTNWVASDALNLAQANLTVAGDEGKGRVYIIAPNDGTALSISLAFQEDPAITEFFITGQDADPANIQAIINGYQSMTVFKDVRTLVSDSIAVARAVLDGRSPQTNGFFDNGTFQVPSLLTEVVSVDRYNLVEVLINGGYYTADMFTFPANFPGR